MPDVVSVLGCSKYDAALLDAVIEKHFAATGANDIISPGANVVIKPNLVIKRRPDEATTTHPEFVAAIARAVKKRGGIPIIAESPGGPYTKSQLKSIYGTTGMEKAAKDSGALLNYDTGYESVSSADYVRCSSFNVISPVLKADVVISAAKLKTHGMMYFSGAVKNMFGTVPGLMKPEFHFRFSEKEAFGEMIVDLCETVRPAISFIDGITAMEGNGPTGGTARFMGITMASLNPHALDLAAAYAAGFKPGEVPTLKSAISRGLCPESAGLLEIAGESLEKFKVKDFKKPDTKGMDFSERVPSFLRGPVEALLTPRPVIRTATCLGCGKCSESCPAKAISIKNKIACIDYKKCIKCFCCHEMCPVKSIDIRRMAIFGKQSV